MARSVKVSEFQRMQRGPQHVGLAESEAAGDVEQNGQDLVARDPMTGQLVDASATRPPGFRNPPLTVAEQLAVLVLEDDIAGMPLGQVVGLVRIAVAKAHVNAVESEIRAEAERRFRLMSEQPAVEPYSTVSDAVARQADYESRRCANCRGHRRTTKSDDEPLCDLCEEKARAIAAAEGLPLYADAPDEVIASLGQDDPAGDLIEPEDRAPQILAEKHQRGLHAGWTIGGCPSCDETVELKPEDQAEPIIPDAMTRLVARELAVLNVGAECSEEMPLGMVIDRVRAAVIETDWGKLATEAEIVAEAERIWGTFADQRKGPRVATLTEPTMADELQRLGVELVATAEMSLAMIKARVGAAAYDVDPFPTEEELDAEADRIWRSFNRAGPREATVNERGEVEAVRPSERTPDRGPDVGTTHHTVTDDEPRFSGAGTEVQTELLFAIPSAAKFGTAPYIAAPTLEEMAVRLMANKPAFDELRDLDIVFRWKAKGGNQKGWPRLGGIERVSGQTLAFIAGPAPDLLVWLAADTLRDSGVTEIQVEAMLFDQLASVEWSDGDEDGDPTWRLVGPEIMCHLATLEEYGAFTRKLQAAKPAFSQPSLFDAAPVPQEPGLTEEEAERVIAMAHAAHQQLQVTDDGAGVLIHADGTPLTDDEIEAMERHELNDDPAEDDDVAYGERLESAFGLADEPADPDAEYDGDPLADHDL